MKKFIFSFVFILLFASACVYAETTEKVSLSSDSIKNSCNRTQEILVSLNADGVNNLYTTLVEIEYDTKMLSLDTQQIQSISWSDNNSSYKSIYHDSQKGRIKSIISSACTIDGKSGNVNILQMKFRTKIIGETILKIKNIELINSKGENIDIQLNNEIKVKILPNPLEISLTGEIGNNGWYKSNVGIIVNDLDAQSISIALDGVKYPYYYNFNVATSGTHSAIVTTDDGYGFIKEKSIEFKIDNIKPTVSANMLSPEITNKDIVITPSFSDEGFSKLYETKYQWCNSENLSNTWEVYSTGNITQSNEGKWYLGLMASDMAGNIKTEVYGPYIIDRIAPTVNVDVESTIWSNQDVSVLPKLYDTGGAGLGDVCYYWSLSTDETKNWTKYSSGGIIQKIEGEWYLNLKVEDIAGNITEKKYGTYKIDKTPPAITHAFNSKYTYTDTLKLDFDAVDVVSGISSTYVLFNGEKYNRGDSVELTKMGENTIEMYAIDSAGNQQKEEKIIFVSVVANITVEPSNINFKNEGNGIVTIYIEFPGKLDVNDIIHSLIKLNGSCTPINDPKLGYVKNPVQDYDDDGKNEYVIKFRKEDLKQSLIESDGNITISGETLKYDFKGFAKVTIKN